MKKTLNIASHLQLPIDFVTWTQVVLAQKGRGKSYLTDVQAEELLEAKQQVVIIDPVGAHWGLRASADGKSAGYSIVVFGGEHGDIALETNAGELVADAIAAEHFSAIIDLSLFRKGDSLRFMWAFLETLYRKNREAMHLFIDEADVVAPQKPFSPDQSRVLGATEDIVRRGRQRGIGCTLVTQRPQVLNKDVLTQAELLTTLGMNHPKDIGAIQQWIAVHGDPDAADRMIASLPALKRGDAWFWAPTHDIFQRGTVREKRTFDSGRTPKAGERIHKPKVLAPVDVERLGSRIAETAARQRENDPTQLRTEVVKLRKQLADTTKLHDAEAEQLGELKARRSKGAPVIKDSQIKRLEQLDKRVDATIDRARKLAAATIEAEGKVVDVAKSLHVALCELIGVVQATRNVQDPAKPFFNYKTLDGVQREQLKSHDEVFKPSALVAMRPAARDRSASSTSATDPKMPRIQRAMLTALAERPEGLTLKKLRIATGYADSGPTSKAIRDIGANGWAVKDVELLAITHRGLAALGEFTPLPKGDDLRAMLLTGSRLNTAERKMLAVICDAWPRTLTRDEIRMQAGYKDSGPTSAAMRKLVNLDYVIDNGRAGLRADDALFSRSR